MFSPENSEISPPALLNMIKELYFQYKSLKEDVATNYIPELAKINPKFLKPL
jgi:hypothetical protein